MRKNITVRTSVIATSHSNGFLFNPCDQTYIRLYSTIYDKNIMILSAIHLCRGNIAFMQEIYDVKFS